MKATCRRRTLQREPNCKSKTEHCQDLRTGSNGENLRLTVRTDLDVFVAKLNPPKIGITELVCLGLIGVVVPALTQDYKKGSNEHNTNYGENQESLHPHSGSHSERL